MRAVITLAVAIATSACSDDAGTPPLDANLGESGFTYSAILRGVPAEATRVTINGTERALSGAPDVTIDLDFDSYEIALAQRTIAIEFETPTGGRGASAPIIECEDLCDGPACLGLSPSKASIELIVSPSYAVLPAGCIECWWSNLSIKRCP